MLGVDHLGEGEGVELIEEFHQFFEDGEGVVLGGDRVHVGGAHLLVPVLLGDLHQGVLYHPRSIVIY